MTEVPKTPMRSRLNPWYRLWPVRFWRCYRLLLVAGVPRWKAVDVTLRMMRRGNRAAREEPTAHE